MPLIYGKTLMSTVKDNIIAKLSRHITRKEGFTAAQIFFKYFREKYKTVDNLIQLIRDIAWVVTSANQVVRILNEFMCTLQDYLCHEKKKMYMYKYTIKSKRRWIRKKSQWNVVTGKKDRRKSVTATFVNLIHQRDGYIAMKFVESLDMDTPIYTVHENCISTARHCEKFPDFYLDVFIKMRSPLLIINQLKKLEAPFIPGAH